MNVRLVQLDGALPNLALMKLAHWHRAQGDVVHLTRHVTPTLFESQYDRVYGSSIFVNLPGSYDRREAFKQQWPDGVIGGTGTTNMGSIEDVIGTEWSGLDYQDYPDFDASIGFTQRGCRLSCGFCVVPKKEGKNRSVATVHQIWRGDPWPKKLHLLDNDFFGNPDWRQRVQEIREGKFRVCISQGINTRLINDEAAEALATIEYRNTRFNERKLYTAWDNLGDEKRFFDGVDRLERAGIPGKHLMAYMLIGYDITETWERIWHRFNRMVERGIEPYPMVYDRKRKDLLCFQRWVITGLYRIVPWEEYRRSTKSAESVAALPRSSRKSGTFAN
jgi:hypothetical protein